jgi:hypothetical protein
VTTPALFYILAGICTITAFAQTAGQPSETKRLDFQLVRTNLKLAKTVIDTETDALSLSATPAIAFSQVKFTCPVAHTKGCTIRVDISSQFWNIPAGTAAQMSVSCPGGNVNPSPVVNVDADTTGNSASVHTFQWMIVGIVAGSVQTVDVSFDVLSGNAFAGYRTETAQLFLN